MKEKNVFKEVFLPHIAYTVRFKDLSYLQGVDKRGGAYTLATDDHTTYVFIENIKETVKNEHNFPMIAHEIIHVLQNICKSRLMDFTREEEHIAYIMAHLLNELLGFKFNVKSHE